MLEPRRFLFSLFFCKKFYRKNSLSLSLMTSMLAFKVEQPFWLPGLIFAYILTIVVNFTNFICIIFVKCCYILQKKNFTKTKFWYSDLKVQSNFPFSRCLKFQTIHLADVTTTSRIWLIDNIRPHVSVLMFQFLFPLPTQSFTIISNATLLSDNFVSLLSFLKIFNFRFRSIAFSFRFWKLFTFTLGP